MYELALLPVLIFLEDTNTKIVLCQRRQRSMETQMHTHALHEITGAWSSLRLQHHGMSSGIKKATSLKDCDIVLVDGHRLLGFVLGLSFATETFET